MGVYRAVLTITTVNGCTGTDTIYIRTGSKPVASFTAAPIVICNHQDVYFTNNSTNATSYLWDFGNGISSLKNPVHKYTASGVFTVTLRAYNNGCEDSFKVDSMIRVHPPTSVWHPVYHCDNHLKVKFWDTATVGADSFIWYFGDGTTTTGNNPEHVYPQTGIYDVSLVTHNNQYGCKDTLTQQVTLVDPKPSFVTPDTAICQGDSITFNSSYNGIATRYDWYIGAHSRQDTTANYGYRFHQSGVYPVSVVISDIHDCKDTATRDHYILVAQPKALFKAQPPVGCAPLTVLFTDTSTNTPGAYSATRIWDFGNGTRTVTTAATSHTYPATANVYSVRLIVIDNVGCTDTLDKLDYIETRKPLASFYADDTAGCIGQVISFLNTSTGSGLNAQWDFGDGTSSADLNPTHVYSSTGTYHVRLVIMDGSGCRDTVIKNSFINISKPDASFRMSDTLAICPPLNVSFTGTSTGAATYNWSFGNNSGSQIQHPSSVYTDPGIYAVMFIAINSQGCTDTAYGRVNVLGYAGGLDYAPLSGCNPLDVAFTAHLKNVPSLIWDFSDGVTEPVSSSNQTVHTYVTPGAYVPKLLLSDGAGCLNSSEGLDTIRVDGIHAGFISTPACENVPVIFTDTSYSFFSTVNSWNWDFNNGQQIDTISNPSFTYAEPGSYPLRLIVTNANGCKDTIDRNITIYPLPTISAGADTAICSGDAAQLMGTGGVSYVWAPTDWLSCVNCQGPFANPTAVTDYVVTGTDANGCSNYDTIRVNIQLVTTSIAGEGGAICDDSSFQLMASGAHRYEWKPSATLDDSKVTHPIASPHETTVYTVMAWEGSCPPDSHTVRVVVYPLPNINAGNDQTIVAGGNVMLQASGTSINNFLWSPMATLSCETCSNPVASPLVTTTYYVKATSAYGCRSSDSVTVHILCDQSQLFIPNLFSPNGDGQNDVFYARGQGLKEISSFRVYNRWGEQVFERHHIQLNDEANAWDGTYKGAALSPDVFVYVLDGICDTGSPISWKGDISLIR